MKKPIHSDDAPKAIGPYSQAIRAGHLLFLSGQIPLDPKTNSVVEGGIAEQTARVLENLQAVLEGAGLTLKHVVKTTVFLKDMGEFGAMNVVYGRFFNENAPARSTVEVSRLPRDVQVEIDLIATFED